MVREEFWQTDILGFCDCAGLFAMDFEALAAPIGYNLKDINIILYLSGNIRLNQYRNQYCYTP